MNKMNFMKVNIRQFEAEDDFSQFVVDGELDTDAIINMYNSESEENNNEIDLENESENNESESEDGEEGSENSDDLEDLPEGKSNENNENSEQLDDSLDNKKRTPDEAFADMRRQLEANEPLAKWVQELATQQGFSDPQELIDEFNKQKIAREAEEQGVPVDVYQRLHYLEQENKTQRDKAIEAQFHAEVEATKNKHGLTEEQLTPVFDFMNQHGYGAGSIPFEHAYLLANSENLIKDAEERGRQEYLEQKQRKQRQATPVVKTHATDTTSTDELDMSQEAIFAKFKEFDIDIN